MSDSGYDTRRAILGVVIWIAVLLAGYWLVTDWPVLPHLTTLLTNVVH